MGFAVLPVQVPEIAPAYDAYFAAFADDPVTQALFPSASRDDLTNPESDFRKSHTSHVLAYWQTPASATQYTLKCIDTETGKIVGMALWDVYIAASNWKPPGVTWLSGHEKETAERLVAPLWSARERMWSNRNYLYCHVIAVHPDYQRRGVGRALVEFGLQIAERAALPVYIESSPAGVALYEKLGCRRLKEKIVYEGGCLANPTAAKSDAKTGAEREVTLMVWFAKGGENCLPKEVELE